VAGADASHGRRSDEGDLSGGGFHHAERGGRNVRLVWSSEEVAAPVELFGAPRARLASCRSHDGGWAHRLEVWMAEDHKQDDDDSTRAYLEVVLKSRGPVTRPQSPSLQLLPGGKA
jgi:hypothetical protein